MNLDRLLARLVIVCGLLASFSPVVLAQAPRPPWTSPPTVTVIAADDDPRRRVVREAVDFWNQQFEELGSNFRIGAVSDVTAVVPEEALQQLSKTLIEGGKPIAAGSYMVPPEISGQPGDLLIVLARSAFVSFAGPPFAPARRMIALRGMNEPPFTWPAVTRNVIAHEIGHAVGLGHNADPSKLMCGRPAPCRPWDFASDVERWFELTQEEKQRLVALYPPG